MDDLRLFDDLHRLVPRLARLPRRQQVDAVRLLLRQLGDVDGVIYLQGEPWHGEYIRAAGASAVARMQVGAVSAERRTREAVMLAGREVCAELTRQIRAMEISEELDRLAEERR